MAVHKGIEGTIKVDSNAVAEFVSYSFTENIDLIETTNIAGAARAYTTGKTSWGGEISSNWDETDTNGQVALSPGSSVTLVLYPEGADSGDTYYTGTALVTSHSVSGSFDGMVTASIGATYTGAVTTATV